jgi:peptide/nickel transport system permease protein
VTAVQAPVVATAPPTSSSWRRWARRRGTITAFVLLGFLVALAIVGPLLSPYDPTKVDPASQFLPPSASHWFGTDRSGFDIFSRVVTAARLDLVIAFGAVMLSVIIGVPIGVVMGYVGGRPDGLVMRGFDVVQAFPVLVLAIGVLATLGQGTINIILVVGLVGVPTYVRLTRGQVMSLRERSYVESARSVGNTGYRIVSRYLLPGTLGTVAVQVATSFGWAIILTAALGFLGLGVPIPTPEWGYMVSTGVEDMTGGQWWTSVFPGLAIVLAVLTFNLVGEALADVVDPRRRERL